PSPSWSSSSKLMSWAYAAPAVNMPARITMESFFMINLLLRVVRCEPVRVHCGRCKRGAKAGAGCDAGHGGGGTTECRRREPFPSDCRELLKKRGIFAGVRRQPRCGCRHSRWRAASRPRGAPEGNVPECAFAAAPPDFSNNSLQFAHV